MDLIKHSGALLVSYLQQTSLVSHAITFHRHLYYHTPIFCFSVVVPVLLALQGTVWGKNSSSVSPVVALQMIYALVWGLRGNSFKQWALGEDRPYWWVKESHFYNDSQSPYLQQFPVTCMASPASPSFPIVATVGSILLAQALSKLVREVDFGSSFEANKKVLVPGIWVLAVFNIVHVATADMLFSSHFPHQVISSVLIGLIATAVVLHLDFSKTSSLKKTFLVNFLLMSITFSIMIKRDVNEFNEYQKKAFKWCLKREWLQMDQTPFLDGFILVGYILGTASATATHYYKKLNKAKFTFKMVVSLLILNLGGVQLIILLADLVPRISTSPHVYGWYVCQMVGAFMMSFLSAAVMPYLVQRASKVTDAKIKKT